MIRAALISHSPHLFGAERSILSLAELFCNKHIKKNKDNNYIQTVLMIPEWENGEMAEAARFKNLNFCVVPKTQWYIYKSPDEACEFDLFCKELKTHIKEYINIFIEQKIDVVIANTLTLIVPHIAAHILGIPVISWIHGVIDSKAIPGLDASYQAVMDKAVINLSDRLIFNSKWTEKQYVNLIRQEDFITIPNWSVEADEEACGSNKNSFICLSWMDVQKGNCTLVDAAKKVKDEGFKFSAALYGFGPEKDNLIKQINTLGLEEYVKINPFTVDIGNIYKRCIALIQPSYFESFGRTIIEAMSFKKPVIAADTADPEGIIEDGINGFHFNKGNSDQLADRMIYLLNNGYEVKKMGERGYELYKELYNGDAAKKVFAKLFYELASSKNVKTSRKQHTYELINHIHNLNL